MLVEKQTCFENHHHQKKFCQENNSNQTFLVFSISSLLLLARCEIVLTLLFVTKFACFNFVLNIELTNY